MMKGWVAAPPAAAVPFNVPCANGHRLRGHRTEGYQALRCPSCGEAVFILPLSPLPEPPAAASARSRTARAVVDAYPSDDAPHALVDPPAWAATPAPAPIGDTRPDPAATDDMAEIDWVDEVAAPAPTPRPATPAPRPGPVRPQRSAATAPVPVAPPSAPPPEPAARLSWGEWASAHRNALMVAALVLVVGGAIAVRRHRQRLEALPRIAEVGRTEGFQKLDSGDFYAAKKLLADAAAAVDAMSGRFAGAESIRQAAREAAIFTDRVPGTLEELVDEAITFPADSDWSAHFRGKYRGRSILLETTITAVPDPARPGSRFEDAYRIMVGRGPKPGAQGRIGYDGLALFQAAPPKLGDTTLIGARVASLEFDIAENTWVLALEPDSGVFITHTAALEAMHWPTGEPVEEAAP